MMKMSFVPIVLGMLCIAQSGCTRNSSPCADVFRETNRLSDEMTELSNEAAQTKQLLKITASMIKATETYLANCTASREPLSKQDAALQKLIKMAKQDCPDNRMETQLIDADKDGNLELVLHTKLLACTDFSGPYGAGFSSIYFMNKDSKTWKGYPIWPTKLMDNPSKMDLVGFIYPQYRPKITVLDFHDTKGRSFMAIESEFEGGDNLTDQLSVIRWDRERKSKTVVQLSLSDSCGQSHYWTIEKSGTVEVAEAPATDRCEARNKKVYLLEQP